MEKRKHDEKNKEEVVSKEEIRYKGKLFEVVSEPVEIDGKTFAFEKVRRSPGVRLIIGDGQGNIMLTREFRRELSEFDYRLPGGKVFDSLDEFNKFKQSKGNIIEKAKQAALKEAKEEGDISENAGFDAAKEAQAVNEGRIEERERAGRSDERRVQPRVAFYSRQQYFQHYHGVSSFHFFQQFNSERLRACVWNRRRGEYVHSDYRF